MSATERMRRRRDGLRLANQTAEKAGRAFRRELAAARSTKPAAGFVYFVGADCGRRIKIGWTGGDPRQRLRHLQTASAVDLTLLVAVRGTKDDERRLHSAFCLSVARSERTEWFTESDRLVALLAALGARMLPLRATQHRREEVEAAVREQFAWILGRQTYGEAQLDACRRALSQLR